MTVWQVFVNVRTVCQNSRDTFSFFCESMSQPEQVLGFESRPMPVTVQALSIAAKPPTQRDYWQLQ